MERRVAHERLVAGEQVALAPEPADPFDAPDEGRPPRGHHAVEFVLRRPVGQKARDLFLDHGVELVEVVSRQRRRDDAEDAGDLEGEGKRADVGGDPLVVDHALVQARGLALGEDSRDEVQPVRVGVAEAGPGPRLVEAGLGYAVLHGVAVDALEFRDPLGLARERRPGRDVAEEVFDALPGVLGFYIAGQDQDGVGRAVVVTEPLPNILETRGVQVLHAADDGPGVGMPGGKEVLEEDVEDAAVRLVLPLALLVLHDAALLVEACLVDHAEEVAHAVRLHPEREVEGVLRHDLEVVGAIAAGRPVHAGGADALERPEVLVVVVLGAVEHQVLEEVRETGLAGLLVLRTDVVPDVDGDDGRLGVLMDDQPQAVVQGVLRKGDVDALRVAVGRPVDGSAANGRREQQGDGPGRVDAAPGTMLARGSRAGA